MPLIPGDSLEPLMLGTGLAATQNMVEADRVNAYERDMAAGNWTWLPPSLRNPIIIDQAGNIMSGHHRLVAARLAVIRVPDAAIVRYPSLTTRTPRARREVSVI